MRLYSTTSKTFVIDCPAGSFVCFNGIPHKSLVQSSFKEVAKIEQFEHAVTNTSMIF